MHERLSFYVPRDSLLHSANPLTKLVLVMAFIIISYFSPWYWTATVLVLGNILLSFLGEVQREYMRAVTRLLLPVVGFLFVMQSLFLPYGETEIFSFWFITVYVENIQTAYLNASRIFVMVSSFILFVLTTHPSALMTDLAQRGVPGQLSYVVVSTLQILPQMQAKASTIIDAQRSRGLDTQGSLRKRIGALLPLVSPLVFGSLVEVEERAIAIEARGFTSDRKKTALREVTDTRADRALRWSLVLLTLAVLALRIWLR
jgi:energy-coupling factor transport system permease protein